jgi:anaerobic glycerol-3-phosphate dehydrogenase
MEFENSPSKLQDLLSSLERLQKMAKEHPNLLNADCLQKSIDQANRLLAESTTSRYSSTTGGKSVSVNKKAELPFMK